MDGDGCSPLSRTAGEGASGRSPRAGEGLFSDETLTHRSLCVRSPLSRNAGEGLEASLARGVAPPTFSLPLRIHYDAVGRRSERETPRSAADDGDLATAMGCG